MPERESLRPKAKASADDARRHGGVSRFQGDRGVPDVGQSRARPQLRPVRAEQEEEHVMPVAVNF